MAEYVVNVRDLHDPRNNIAERFNNLIGALDEIVRLFAPEVIDNNIRRLLDGEVVIHNIPNYGVVHIWLTGSDIAN